VIVLKLSKVVTSGVRADCLSSMRRAGASLVYQQSNNKCVQVQSFQPTSDSAALHSRRSYYWYKRWIKLDGTDLNPLDWGWTVATGDDKCMPLKNTLPLAPDRLLNSPAIATVSQISFRWHHFPTVPEFCLPPRSS
jgi:hypothetical protein